MIIWIINHYAMPPEYEMRLRTIMMSKYLQEMGHEVIIFAASTIHNTDINLIDKNGPLYIEKDYGELRYVHVKTSKYSGNGITRIKNMLEFPFRLIKVSKQIKVNPDVIICDLGALLAPIPYWISKAKKAKFVLEVRDLWPESIIEYKKMSRKNPIVKAMYLVEKWIYKRADEIIFTMEGGKDYIIEKRWDEDHGGTIDINKIHHINNGVDLRTFNYNKSYYQIMDKDLDEPDIFKVIYTGSIRLANNVKSIVDAAVELKKLGFENIKFIIYGDGSDRVPLEQYCSDNSIDNVVFKGFIDKKYIPYILSKSDLNIVHFEQNSLKRYGASLNKLFEYFASGKPTLSDCEFGYDLITKYKCGITLDGADAKMLAKQIIKFKELDDIEYNEYCSNAIKAANDYDFKKLSNKLTEVIGGQINE